MRLIFVGSVGIIKALCHKTHARLYFWHLARIRTRKTLAHGGKSWSCVRKGNQRGLAHPQREAFERAQRAHEHFAAYLQQVRSSSRMLNKSLKLWLNLKAIGKSTRNRRSCQETSFFCQRTFEPPRHYNEAPKCSFTVGKFWRAERLASRAPRAEARSEFSDKGRTP